jgi:RHS repeat-associated protein
VNSCHQLSIFGFFNPSLKNYDADGNVISRSWTSGVTQTLSWDAFDRLIQVSQRDSSQNGYDWTALYDGLGRRISTTLQPVANNVDTGAPTVTASIYDPQVEFLEIGVSVNGVQAYKVYGPDLNGVYGGLQGTGGLEATIMNGTGAATGVINDYFGNGVATISGGSVTWNTTKVGGYGPLPDSAATPLTDATQLAQAIIWRGHYIDPTGFYNLGARYYEPTSGRFLSPDPKGQAASMSLYDFCNGDPVNGFDPDGRCAEKAAQGAVTGGSPDGGGEPPNPGEHGRNPADPNSAMTQSDYYDVANTYNSQAAGLEAAAQENYDEGGRDDLTQSLQAQAQALRQAAQDAQNRGDILFNSNVNSDNYRQAVIGAYGINNPNLNSIMGSYASYYGDQATLNFLANQHPATQPAIDPNGIAMMALLPAAAAAEIGTTSSEAGPSTSPQSTQVPLANNEAVLVVTKDGQIVSQQPTDAMLTHEELATQAGAVDSEGNLKPGYWVGTVGKNGSDVIAINSMTYYGNQMPNADATDAARKVFK